MTEGLLPCYTCDKEGAQMYQSKYGYYVQCPHCGQTEAGHSNIKTSADMANWWNSQYLKSPFWKNKSLSHEGGEAL